MRPNKRTSLLHLIYFSRLNLPAEIPARNRAIEDIARHAQKKNEFSVITSFLMVDQNFAVQILEGERTSVTDTFNRIVRDSRHRDVHIVEWREIAKRDFVHSFTTSVRGPASEAVFAKANLLPSFQRGTPKGSAILALAQQLQAESMTKQGIEHLFV
ncbi:BLUF domain-containing protein [Methylobacterium gossipiicola]|uniref:Sensors of blue-light using FAD n=1 Tax=Methylobacterium gossipiicola TaxID=582675 RepID=A0A1I2UGW3_9HYPH|nr:BLUF domain-containing protein [Methylobacterium gossipiicola]SFG76300.1 Sensors of blue-light using FAD [Methylobacterium gossipiicola]